MNAKHKNAVVVKTFIYRGKYYLYDTYTNRLCEIEKEHFAEIERLQSIGLSEYLKLNSEDTAYNDVKWLLNKGMLKEPFIDKVEHSETKYVPFLLRNCINDLTLQVTRDCNFKCRYCLYASDTQVERHHENRNMSWDIAKCAIDFLYSHSVDAKQVKISFYGGEPLLNFSLIKNSVIYATEVFQAKPISYSMTINGALLNDEIIDFLQQYKFFLTISLDGPKHIQNFHRKFLANGNGTFDTVYNNILRIKMKYDDYFKEYVTFNPVLFEGESITQAFTIFEKMGVSEDKVFFVMLI